MRAFTIVGWLVSFLACCVVGFIMASYYGVLLALAVGAALLTVFVRVEELHVKQDDVRNRLEEIYEMLKRGDVKSMSDAERTLFVRCPKCNGRHEKTLDKCPFCAAD